MNWVKNERVYYTEGRGDAIMLLAKVELYEFIGDAVIEFMADCMV